MKKAGKIAAVVLFFAVVAGYLYLNYAISAHTLSSVDWPTVVFLLLLYAVIPGVPLFLLRLGFGVAPKWLALAATALGALCLVPIVLGLENIPENYAWIATFAQYALVSSVPVLYCAAFFGRKEAWVAILPSFLYFFGFFLNHGLMYGLGSVMDLLRHFDFMFVIYQNPDPYIMSAMVMLVVMGSVFVAWALLLVFASHMVHKFATREKADNRKNKKRKGVGKL